MAVDAEVVIREFCAKKDRRLPFIFLSFIRISYMFATTAVCLKSELSLYFCYSEIHSLHRSQVLLLNYKKKITLITGCVLP